MTEAEELKREEIKLARRRHFDLDVRGILALMAICGAFGLSITGMLTNHLPNAEIPAWVVALVSGVTGFYFGSRAGGSNGRP